MSSVKRRATALVTEAGCGLPCPVVRPDDDLALGLSQRRQERRKPEQSHVVHDCPGARDWHVQVGTQEDATRGEVELRQS